MLKIVTLLFGLLLTHMAIAQNQPLACQTEADAGLKWQHGRWQTKEFDGVKFVLGGFKFEAQRALKIDGTPLKVF